MAGFETLATRVLQRVAFLELVEQDLRTPDGDEVTRVTVKHPGAVVVVPVDDDEQVVMVRQFRVAAGRELLEVPAGKREIDEDPEVTAARELSEEVGMRAGRLLPLAEFFNSPGFCDEYTHVFLGLDLDEHSSDFEGRAEERHMTIERVPLDRALQLVATGEIIDAKTVAGVALAKLHRSDAYAGRVAG